jgi:hypothetical protein
MFALDARQATKHEELTTDFQAGLGVTTADNVIVIGANVPGANVSNTCFIGNIRGVATAKPTAIPTLKVGRRDILPWIRVNRAIVVA